MTLAHVFRFSLYLWSVSLVVSAVSLPLSDSDRLATSALGKLQADYGLSLTEIRDLGLTSQDLAELGIKDIRTRLALLRRIRLPFTSTTPTFTDNRVALQTQDFVFVISHFNSTRQWGKCLNMIIKYRYIPGAKANSTGGGYLDYRDVRKLALAEAQPTPKLPIGVQWELINKELVDKILLKYAGQITSISSQIQVLSEINPKIQEPGNHGSIVTRYGNDKTFKPLSEPWINAFRYDCTKSKAPGFH